MYDLFFRDCDGDILQVTGADAFTLYQYSDGTYPFKPETLSLRSLAVTYSPLITVRPATWEEVVGP